MADALDLLAQADEEQAAADEELSLALSALGWGLQ